MQQSIVIEAMGGQLIREKQTYDLHVLCCVSLHYLIVWLTCLDLFLFDNKYTHEATCLHICFFGKVHEPLGADALLLEQLFTKAGVRQRNLHTVYSYYTVLLELLHSVRRRTSP